MIFIYHECGCSLCFPACNARARYYIAISGLSVSINFFLISSKTAWFSENKVIEHITCDFIFSTILSEAFHMLRIKEILSQMYVAPHVKYLLFLFGFNETWIFSTGFRKIVKYQVSLKYQWKPSCFVRTDRQTHMTKLILVRLNFANAPKNTVSNEANTARPHKTSHTLPASNTICVPSVPFSNLRTLTVHCFMMLTCMAGSHVPFTSSYRRVCGATFRTSRRPFVRFALPSYGTLYGVL